MARNALLVRFYGRTGVILCPCALVFVRVNGWPAEWRFTCTKPRQDPTPLAGVLQIDRGLFWARELAAFVKSSRAPRHLMIVCKTPARWVGGEHDLVRMNGWLAEWRFMRAVFGASWREGGRAILSRGRRDARYGAHTPACVLGRTLQRAKRPFWHTGGGIVICPVMPPAARAAYLRCCAMTPTSAWGT